MSDSPAPVRPTSFYTCRSLFAQGGLGGRLWNLGWDTKISSALNMTSCTAKPSIRRKSRKGLCPNPDPVLPA